MQKDLFGNDVIVEDPICLKTLKELDADTLEERTKRCNLLISIMTEHSIWFGSDESYYIFLEIRLAYISGCFISTIILAQSFIERKFQENYYMSLDPDPRFKFTLDKILKELRRDKSIDPYWIERIDKIRKKGNPFVHFKTVMNEASISQRSGHNSLKAMEIIEQDAKEALEIMCAVTRMRRVR